MPDNKNRKPASELPAGRRRTSTAALAAATLLVIAAAVIIRVRWQHGAQQHGAPPPQLLMDDSGAILPLNPPPLPGDNAALLKQARLHVDLLASSAGVSSRIEAAEAAEDMGDLWRAESLSREALKQDPGSHLAALTLASSLRRQARFDAAAAIYQQLLHRDSRDSDAYLGLADTAFAANQRPQAFEWLDRGVQHGAQTAVALTTYAHRYQDWKDYTRAGATALRAIQAAPNDIDAQLELASIRVEGGNLDAAYQTLDSILKTDPNNGLARRLMGVTLMDPSYAHQDVNRARSLLESAVELNVKDANIYRSVAVIYQHQHLYRLAAQAYDALLQLDPTSIDARYGLGEAYALLGKKDLSAAQIALYRLLDGRQQQTTRLNEDVVHNVMSAQAHLALANYLVSAGDYARALPEYQSAQGLEPNSMQIKSQVNRLYRRLGWPLPFLAPR